MQTLMRADAPRSVLEHPMRVQTADMYAQLRLADTLPCKVKSDTEDELLAHGPFVMRVATEPTSPL